MNTEFDPLEAELRSLRPRDPSPKLKQQIAAELLSPPALPCVTQRTSARGLSHPVPRYALIAAALAASLLALAIYLPRNTVPTIVSPPPLAESPTTAAFDATLPSVWQFHNALNRSPGDLDAALDQHAARSIAPAISLVQIRGFGHSDSNLETLLGEL